MINFYKISSTKFKTIEKSSDSFYLVDNKDLYLGEKLLTNAESNNVDLSDIYNKISDINTILNSASTLVNAPEKDIENLNDLNEVINYIYDELISHEASAGQSIKHLQEKASLTTQSIENLNAIVKELGSGVTDILKDTYVTLPNEQYPKVLNSNDLDAWEAGEGKFVLQNAAPNYINAYGYFRNGNTNIDKMVFEVKKINNYSNIYLEIITYADTKGILVTYQRLGQLDTSNNKIKPIGNNTRFIETTNTATSYMIAKGNVIRWGQGVDRSGIYLPDPTATSYSYFPHKIVYQNVLCDMQNGATTNVNNKMVSYQDTIRTYYLEVRTLDNATKTTDVQQNGNILYHLIIIDKSNKFHEYYSTDAINWEYENDTIVVADAIPKKGSTGYVNSNYLYRKEHYGTPIVLSPEDAYIHLVLGLPDSTNYGDLPEDEQYNFFDLNNYTVEGSFYNENYTYYDGAGEVDPEDPSQGVYFWTHIPEAVLNKYKSGEDFNFLFTNKVYYDCIYSNMESDAEEGEFTNDKKLIIQTFYVLDGSNAIYQREYVKGYEKWDNITEKDVAWTDWIRLDKEEPSYFLYNEKHPLTAEEWADLPEMILVGKYKLLKNSLPAEILEKPKAGDFVFELKKVDESDIGIEIIEFISEGDEYCKYERLAQYQNSETGSSKGTKVWHALSTVWTKK